MTLIFLGAGYFFIYLPHNERRIQEQRFSALQNIDRNIHTKIENSVSLLNNLLNDYQGQTTEGRVKLIKYINEYSSVNFRLTVPAATLASKAVLLSDSLYKDSAYTIKVNNDTREISLLLSKQEELQSDVVMVYTIGMKFSFKQFIQFLLPKDVFDEYVVFSKSKLVYESFPTGISNIKEDSLLGIKNGIGSSGVRSQVISGTDYKMFLQPVGFDANNEWIIGGLLSNKHYQNEKSQLPTQLMLLLATIMLIGMVAFPWLKLYQMGSKDRLTALDGIASIFISMILVSLVFFVIFNFNISFRPSENSDSKNNLAEQINDAFKSEIKTVVHKLQQYDAVASKSRNEFDIVDLDKNSIEVSAGNSPLNNLSELSAIAHGIDINQVFWLDKNGAEKINWTSDKVNAPHGNFKSREYFKKIEEGVEYRLNDKDTNRFFLEQVVSWTSGTFRSVVSMKSKRSVPDSLVVAALSCNLKSLNDVVLPTGYLFAITDNAGNVLYHSDSTRNLNENLLNVFSKSDNLKSCLNANASASFETKYYGNNYEVKVKPLSGLPYFIIVFEDAGFAETKDLETYSFTFSMLFFFFSFLIIQLFAIFLVSAKKSFFKRQLLDTTWVGPKISCEREYILSAVFNGCIILLLILFFNKTTFLQYFFMLLISVTIIPLFLNIIFAKRYSLEKRNVLQFKHLAIYCLCGFIIVIGVFAYKMLEVPQFIYLCAYLILLISLGMAVFAARKILHNMGAWLKNSAVSKMLFGKWNYINSFSLMALTRLIVTSALPVVFFYISSHNYEQNLSIRFKQVGFAKRLIAKFPGILPDSVLAGYKKWNGVYCDGSIIKDVAAFTMTQDAEKLLGKAYTKEEFYTIGCFNLFRLHLTDKAITQDKFYAAGEFDQAFYFNHLITDAISSGRGTVTYLQTENPGRYFRIQSENLNYHYPTVLKENGFNGGLFWLLLGGCLVLFYFIIMSIIKKLFSLNLPDLDLWKQLDSEILINKNGDQPLLVIGLPGAGKKKFLLDKIYNKEITQDDGTPFYFNHPEGEKNNVFIAELINIPSTGNEEAEKAIWVDYTKLVFNDKNRMIIVNHFEYNIQDTLSNRYKLEFLERLFLENKCKIIILSTIHPVAFLDSAMEHLTSAEDKSGWIQNLERWHVLLGHYRIVILPMQLRSDYLIEQPLTGSVLNEAEGYGIPDVSVMVKDTSIKTFSLPDGQFLIPNQPMPFTLRIIHEGFVSKDIIINGAEDLLNIELEEGSSYRSAQLIRQETNHTYFLKKTQWPAFEAGKKLTEEIRVARFDELAFKLQVSSHYFYMYIWQSLTKEEKFLLYDLAEDNLVNAYDDYNLSMLIAKGVVVKPDGTLKLFNRGFRNFILTAIGNSEAMKIKSQIQDNGNWNTLKNPLQLVIVAILAFLLTSQEEAFAKLITYVAALGAGVPAVLKLFTLFDKGSQKPS
jgi:hypothetical protein